MDVFSLRDTVAGEYKQVATSFATIFAGDIRTQIERIYSGDRYWPEPLIQINPNFQPGRMIVEMVAGGELDPRCAEIFRLPPTKALPEGAPLLLHKHQEQAIAVAGQGQSYVVLEPHLDALFDAGFVTIAHDGAVVASELLTPEAAPLSGSRPHFACHA